MHPLLIKLGPIPVHTYGFLIAIGFIVAVSVTKRLSFRAKLPVDRVLDLTFWSLLVGFLGSRILFIITRISYFAENPAAIFRVWEGGLVFLGGPLAVIPFVLWYTKKHKLALWRTMDSMIPGLAIAHMFGRFGCIAAGCCYGKPTGGNWGFKFGHDATLVDEHMRGIYLHPTQLYEASALGILFLGLLWVTKRKHFDGQVILTYFMAYPVIRSIVEIFRGDEIRGFVIQDVLSTSQFISLLLFIAATIVLVWRLKKVKLEGPAPTRPA